MQSGLFKIQQAKIANGFGSSSEFYIGIAIGLILFLLKVPASAIGLGIYLPSYLSIVVGLGYLLSMVVKRITKAEERTMSLISSGLLGGEGIAGVIVAIISIFS